MLFQAIFERYILTLPRMHFLGIFYNCLLSKMNLSFYAPPVLSQFHFEIMQTMLNHLNKCLYHLPHIMAALLSLIKGIALQLRTFSMVSHIVTFIQNHNNPKTLSKSRPKCSISTSTRAEGKQNQTD